MSETFYKTLEKLYAKQEQKPFERAKGLSWNQFSKLGLPKKSDPGFQHVRLRDLFVQEIESVDEGIFETSDVPKEVTLMPLTKAIRTFSTYLQGRFSEHLNGKSDSLSHLNTALFQEGLFIYVPPKCIVDQPIRISFKCDSKSLFSLLAPRIHIFVGKEAEVEFIFDDTIIQNRVWSNSFIDLHLEERAHCDCYFLSRHHEEGFYTESVRATLKKESNLKVLMVTNGSKSERKDYHITLQDELAEVTLEGLWTLHGKRETHVNVFMDHAAPYTKSRQKFKGVLNDVSRSSFEGKIFVRENALKTEGFQANHNLIVSEKALCYTRPNLEIFADDVKASHGATCGSLGQDQLFYLKTRGILEEEAKKILISGFISEMINSIPHAEIQKEARSIIS